MYVLYISITRTIMRSGILTVGVDVGDLFLNFRDVIRDAENRRARSVCCEIPWRPKLPWTLLDVSLLLTVIGGYSNSSGIPAFASNSPPFLSTVPYRPYVYMSLLLLRLTYHSVFFSSFFSSFFFYILRRYRWTIRHVRAKLNKRGKMYRKNFRSLT